MSRSKRTPISYPSSFGEGILRPREVVEAELAALSESEEEPASPPPPRTPVPVPSTDTRKHGNVDTRLHVPNLKEIADSQDGGNVAALPPHDTKYTVYFAQAELDGLDDLKVKLRRKHDLRCTKYLLIRQAVRELLSDYEVNGEDSRIVHWLQQQETG